ncbi:hypothetical protein [Fimbriiglobus ruber]|uniref:Uncharacterized protein n=1 Tax=Fimbriiglobus ruber TaxID=1908690 RepID=A0A225CYZ6_9BACT|nr:hypothetical protein [Fimbriiglobus ruber]OWK34472.1 hypothetical protein FRUB_10443 [Fimbriiglobus ruber]
MKASPTPEPTPPAQPPAAEPSAPPAPTLTADATIVPGPVNPSEKPAASAPHPAAPATWPEWFGAVDFAVAILVLVAGFLAASFLARNSDLWLHLANGRLLSHGDFHPGKDPFSYTGADRPWVNSSWLFDLGAYALYAADQTGAALVAVKAVVFAAAFGCLLLIRRPGQSMLPWVVLSAVGVLAAAPYGSLRPVVGSMLFLSLTLLILFRAEWQPGSWRWPAVLAGLFWIWACTDVWFFLGPLTVALTWAGEWLNRFLSRNETDDRATAEGTSAFPAALPLPSLARATLLGVVASLLNPMFVAAVVRDPVEAVTQLVPMELGFTLPPDAVDDRELSRLALSPIDERYMKSSSRGYSANGLAAALVFAAGTVALVLGFTRLRATHILLWVAFGALALRHVVLIPFFAIVVIPITAAHLNALFARTRLGPWSNPNTRILLTSCAMLRVLSVIAVLAMVAAAYPGWLHPILGEPAYQNRVEWAAEPDPGLKRTAQTLAAWRASGALPESVRGFHASIDLGNHCAWFAPAEKVFIDGRYTFHRAEFPDFLDVRKVIALRITPPETRPDPAAVWGVCAARGADYLVAAKAVEQLDVIAFSVTGDNNPWVLWHLDGRSLVLARGTEQIPLTVLQSLQFNPARRAFAPDQEPLPAGKVFSAPPVEKEFLDRYLDRSQPTPLDVDDAQLWSAYAEGIQRKAVDQFQNSVYRWQFRVILGAVAGPLVTPATPEPPQAEDNQFALPVLVLRAARRAIAAAPDRHEGYRELIKAYRMQFAPVMDVPVPYLAGIAGMTEQQAQIMTAQVRFLARVPEPKKCTPDVRIAVVKEAMNLSETYQKTRQMDFAKGAVAKALAYAKELSHEEARFMNPRDKDNPLKAILSQIQEVEDRHTQFVRVQTDQVLMLPAANQQLVMAIQRQLPLKAMEIYKNHENDPGFDDQPLRIILELKLRAGLVEELVTDLTALDQKYRDQPQKLAGIRPLVEMAMRLGGDYQGAIGGLIDEMDKAIASAVPKEKARAAVALDFPAVTQGLMALTGAPAVIRYPDAKIPLIKAIGEWENTRGAIEIETLYRYDRGLLAIVSGSIAEAKLQLTQAAAPLGVDLARLDPNKAVRVKKYLELIQRSEAQAAGR